VIDEDGYRYGIGIILMNDETKVLWAKRIGYRDAWQFPQGGIDGDESAEEAMYRELEEELGLTNDSVDIIQVTPDWLDYKLPKDYRRYYRTPLCVGQKQKWFLLRLKEDDGVIALDQTLQPEFDQWRWVEYGHPIKEVIFFKKAIYQEVLDYFMPMVESLRQSNQ